MIHKTLLQLLFPQRLRGCISRVVIASNTASSGWGASGQRGQHTRRCKATRAYSAGAFPSIASIADKWVTLPPPSPVVVDGRCPLRLSATTRFRILVVFLVNTLAMGPADELQTFERIKAVNGCRSQEFCILYHLY